VERWSVFTAGANKRRKKESDGSRLGETCFTMCLNSLHSCILMMSTEHKKKPPGHLSDQRQGLDCRLACRVFIFYFLFFIFSDVPSAAAQ
jgi:hypothetical protein